MITVTLYTRDQCPECDQAQADLSMLRESLPHQLVVVNIQKDRGVREKIGDHLPVVEIGPYHLRPPFTRQDLQIMLGAAQDRVSQMERVDQEVYQKRLERGHTLTSADRISNFFSYHYLAIANLVLLLYFGLPFLAPVFMKNGQTTAASWIYKIYYPLCHQLPFRSWFLFGEQPYYPRDLAGIPGIITWEELTHSHEVDPFTARNFTGNEVTGYKVAICERCLAMYASMFLFGMAFWVTRRRLRSIPMYLWVVIGLVPIAFDGLSQLPSLIPGLVEALPASLALVRESTPLLRTLTGVMFGWMTAWYLFPMLEQTAREARLITERKIAVIRHNGPPQAG
ncbi:MAG: DUF2085 domain-containing protein [Chloroflexi bacterium]|nr:MAG: DUF2085 domain-containing protein [Chloroflexota bacterium]